MINDEDIPGLFKELYEALAKAPKDKIKELLLEFSNRPELSLFTKDKDDSLAMVGELLNTLYQEAPFPLRPRVYLAAKFAREKKNELVKELVSLGARKESVVRAYAETGQVEEINQYIEEAKKEDKPLLVAAAIEGYAAMGNKNQIISLINSHPHLINAISFQEPIVRAYAEGGLAEEVNQCIDLPKLTVYFEKIARLAQEAGEASLDTPEREKKIDEYGKYQLRLIGSALEGYAATGNLLEFNKLIKEHSELIKKMTLGQKKYILFTAILHDQWDLIEQFLDKELGEIPKEYVSQLTQQLLESHALKECHSLVIDKLKSFNRPVSERFKSILDIIRNQLGIITKNPSNDTPKLDTTVPKPAETQPKLVTLTPQSFLNHIKDEITAHPTWKFTGLMGHSRHSYTHNGKTITVPQGVKQIWDLINDNPVDVKIIEQIKEIAEKRKGYRLVSLFSLGLFTRSDDTKAFYQKIAADCTAWLEKNSHAVPSQQGQ